MLLAHFRVWVWPACLAAALVTACAPHEASPTLICGQNLAGGYVSPTIVNVTTGNPTVRRGTKGDITFLQLTDSCRAGVAISFHPSGAASVLRRADAADGKPAAVVVRSNRSGFVMELDDGRSSARTVTFSARRGN